MKPVIVFVLAFVVAAAGGTGAKVMMTKPEAKAASDSSKSDSTKADATKDGSAKSAADSTRTDTAIVASGEQAKAPADSGHVAAPAAVAPVVAPGVAQAGKPAAMPAGLPVAKQQAAAPTTAPTNLSAAKAPAISDTVERRLAKVFTSMDAKQAAKVLEHMSDGDVEIILGYVGVKQAAAIMGALPPERVATLSKLAMKGGSE